MTFPGPIRRIKRILIIGSIDIVLSTSLDTMQGIKSFKNMKEKGIGKTEKEKVHYLQKEREEHNPMNV